jgi:hypothetical protein
MRCDREMARVVAASVLALAVCASTPAAAQELRCVPVREGDSAAAVARRLTGDAHNRFARWFQIVDPATRTFVPKSRYDHIRPGWNACLIDPVVPTVTAGATALPGRIEATLAALARDIGAGDPNVLLWLALVAAVVVIFSGLDDQRVTRQPVPEAMRRFGEAFVREFERPLLRQDRTGRPAIQARLRANANKRRLEVLLAPAAGHRYPNLSDHRRNVEYDIGRVLQRLRVPAVLGRAPYAQGQWVVCPFEFAETQQAGGQ